MPTSNRKQAILAGLQTEFRGNDWTHKTVEVTVTSTMRNGSLLIAANTEAAAADAANVTGIIDDPRFDENFAEGYDVGDVVLTRVARRDVIANSDVIRFSDVAYTNQTLTALVNAGVQFRSAQADFTLQ